MRCHILCVTGKASGKCSESPFSLGMEELALLFMYSKVCHKIQVLFIIAHQIYHHARLLRKRMLRAASDVVQGTMLFIAAEPGPPKITLPDGQDIIGLGQGEVTSIGPFNEGQELRLLCESEGGKPIPKVTWYKGTNVISGTRSASILLASLQRDVKTFHPRKSNSGLWVMGVSSLPPLSSFSCPFRTLSSFVSLHSHSLIPKVEQVFSLLLAGPISG